MVLMFQKSMSFKFSYSPHYVSPLTGLVMHMQAAAPEILFYFWFTYIFDGHLIASSDFVSSKKVIVKALQKYLTVSIIVGIFNVN